MFAKQLAFVPPLLPLQLQLQGPVPVAAVAVPVVQKLVVGAIVKAPPLLVPQAPITGVGVILKVAVTFFATSIVIWQAVPVQSPDQPAKVLPLLGVAVRVTTVLVANNASQVKPHEMPIGEEVMLPVPVPVFATVIETVEPT